MKLFSTFDDQDLIIPTQHNDAPNWEKQLCDITVSLADT